jgi:putative membrane protein
MHAGRRFSFRKTLWWSKQYTIIFLIIDSLVVSAYYFFRFDWLVIPWQPISLIGIAVAFYLGFKNNSSYERLWEGRKIWGAIVNASRTFSIMARDFVTNEFAKEPVEQSELNAIHKRIVHRHVAWLFSLTFQLRERRTWEHHRKMVDEKTRKMAGIHSDDDHFPKIKQYLSDEDYEYIMTKGNKASHLVSLQSKDFKELRGRGLIDDFRHMELENMLKEMYTLQGKSERIKNFPFPRQYASANHFFVWIFLLLLPFGMLNIFINTEVNHLIWLSIPFTVLVSWVFYMMEMIGDYSENPFEGLYNDVPITSMSRGIEIDIRQMLDEVDLPEPIKPLEPMNILY